MSSEAGRVVWSHHAMGQLSEILQRIASETTVENALKWSDRFYESVRELGYFPESGMVLPRECFASVPADAGRLRQVICRPYRIVYELVGGEARILAVLHSRMLFGGIAT